MRLDHIPRSFRRSRGWLAYWSRICCVLVLCAAYLSMHRDYRVHGFSSAARGMSDAPVSDGAGKLCYDALQTGSDVILTSARDNDPFLALLLLRTAFVPAPGPFVKSHLLLSEIWANHRAWVSPPDVWPPHLYMLAKSAQLLC